jgi:hypothetical protein
VSEHASPSTVIGAVVAIVAVVAMVVVGLVAGQSTSPAPVHAGEATPAVRTTDAVHADHAEVFTSDAPTPTSTATVSSGATVTTTVSAIASTGASSHVHTATTVASIVVPTETVTTITSITSDDAPAVTVPSVTTTPPMTVLEHDHDDTTDPTGPIISVDDPRLTSAQRAAAIDLIDRTKAGMRGFTSEAAVVAAGYASIGDASSGFEHFVNWGYLSDTHEMDPNHIESIVMRVSGSVKTVESAMYILAIGKTMADVPDIAGDLTHFHDHQNLCFDSNRVVGLTRPDGTCERGTFFPTPPMLHVWIVDQPCGPFAGIEGSGHGSGCGVH